MTIYIVQGATGEYSDHTEWLVKAFKTHEKAKEFLLFLDAKALEIGVKYAYKSSIYSARFAKKEKKMKEFDPQFVQDYTGTSYSILEVELVE